MNNLQVTAKWQIHDGKLEAFKKYGEECLSAVQVAGRDIQQYSWYFNNDQTECVLREQYTDSAAMLAHLANIGGLLPRFFEVADLTAEIYGEASQQLRDATTGLNITFYSFYQGLAAPLPAKSTNNVVPV
jgi:quinol monooxygenase YgiN